MNRFNSTFKIKPRKINEDKPPLPFRASRLAAAKRGRSRLRVNGRRTNDWLKAWRFLKPELEARGRTGCEFGFIPHDCWGRIDPCHSKKRRMMEGNDIYILALGCAQAHRILDEAMSHAEMETAVLRAIQANGGLILPKREAT
jgi:hypothetical protein